MAWNIVDLLFAVTVTSLPAVYSMLISHLPRVIRQRWTGNKDLGSPNFMTANGSHFPYDGNTGGDRSTNPITGRTHQSRVPREHDLESLPTERDESFQEDSESFTRTNTEELRIPEEVHHKK